MAWEWIRDYTGNSTKTSGTNNFRVVIPTGGTPSGRIIIAHIGYDNLSSTTPSVSSIQKPAGETNSWTLLERQRGASTSSGASVWHETWGIETSTSWSAGDYLITLSSAVAAKSTIAREFSGGTLTKRSTSGAVGVNGTAVSISTSGTAPATGDLVIGAISYEDNAAWSADSDTSNGSWSSQLTAGTSGGGGATNCGTTCQYKIVTGSGHQTFDSTGFNDAAAVIIALEPAATAPQVNIDGNRTVTASLAGALEISKDLAGTLGVTATLASTAQADYAASGNRTVTASLAGALAVDRPVDGNLSTTATLTGTLARTVDISGDLTVTANRSADLSTAAVWNHVADYTGALKTTGNLAVAVTAAVGDILFAIVASDDTSGADVLTASSVSDAAGNTWTRIATNQGQSAAGNVAGAIYYSKVTSALTAQNVTLNNSTAAKAMVVSRFTGGSDVERGSYQVGNATAATWTVTHTGPVAGDLVLGAIFMEDADGNTFTGDSDTTNGSWTTAVGAGTTGGGAASNVRVRTQHKIVTATGSQTWDGSLNTSDHRYILIALQVAVSGVDLSGNTTVTATSVGTLAVDRPVSGSLANTATLAGALAVDRPVSGNLGVTATLAGAIDVVIPPVEISGNLGVTATATADVVTGKDISGNLGVTVTTSGALVADRPVSGDLTVTAARSAGAVVDRPVSGNLQVTAGTSAALGKTVGISGNLIVTATRSGDAVTGKDIAGNRAVTVGLSADVQTDRNLSGVLAITSSRAGELTISRTLSGDRTVVVAGAATLTLVAPVAATSIVTAALEASLFVLPPYEPSRISIDGGFGFAGGVDGSGGGSWPDERGGAGSGMG